MTYNEDTLVQQTTADYLRDNLGWESIYAYNQENYGENSLLGRKDRKQIILNRYLEQKLRQFNPNHPDQAYQDAIRSITEYSSSQTLFKINREKDKLLKDGVQISYRNNKGETVKPTLKIFDFDTPTNNHFLAVRELWIEGGFGRQKRADIVGFINGIPLIFMELKNIHRSIRAAYEENYKDYLDTIPQLFHHNALVIFGNGNDAKLGSLNSPFEHFHEWKRLAESDPGIVDMETLLKGVCDKNNLLDIFENFIIFDDSSQNTIKIISRNHQYLGVNKAIEAVKDRQNRQGKLGIFWHTQGSGKSYSMVFFTKKIRRKLGGNFTFIVCTDRDDLDKQIYDTFAGCGLANNDKDTCRASSAEHLQQLLGEHKAYLFTLIQKFNKEVDPQHPYNSRDDIIVISDEAHRSQYGVLSLNLHNALPNASFIGFTGTPLFQDDEITYRYFGKEISTYDFQRAVEDNATVPLYFDPRGDKLEVSTKDLNERIAAKLEELEIENAEDIEKRIERALKRDYKVITSEQRLEAIAQDFVTHYANGWEMGKAMLICIDKVTCGRMYQKITHYWQLEIKKLKKQLKNITDQQEAIYRKRQIDWMETTIAAVIISHQQGEVEKFRQWNLDVNSHRNLINNGFELADGKRVSVEKAFKNADHPFRIAIVCAMWLTGFDVPSLSTIYLDKPLKAHTLMQAIARANRVFEGKNNGLIVDYCGILKNLRAALATFAGTADEGRKEDDKTVDPTQPQENLLDDLQNAINEVREFLTNQGASLDTILQETGFALNAAIRDAKEAVNENDETRQRFKILCREVFRKFKASTNIPRINEYRKTHDAIKLLAKELEKDEEVKNISQVLMELYRVVDEAIEVTNTNTKDGELYDISKINFERLKAEFKKSNTPRTNIQNLKQAVEKRLRRMLNQNTSRVDYQKHYEEIVDRYNREKDRLIIEQTFEELLKFIQDLDEEAQRATSEGLSEETLAIFDLLKKPNIQPAEIKRIKGIASNLLQILKQEILQMDQWYDKEFTRDRIKIKIENFLYSDDTGLPESYEIEEVTEKTKVVFLHVMQVYKTIPSPYYENAA
jgi:type I site-specific deoxyribonuclease, HsdR family